MGSMAASGQDLGKTLSRMSAKLQHNQLNAEAKGKARDSFGFAPRIKKGSKQGDKTAELQHKGVKKAEKKAVQKKSFGFAGKMTTPNKNKAAKPSAELGESMHLWINNKPIQAVLHKKPKVAARKVVSPQKEVANKKKANQIANLEHIWINGKPYVSKTAAKKKTAVVPKQLGEEGLEQMRAMRISAKHVGGSSNAVENQNRILGDAEYAFSIHNTDKEGKPMGLAKKVQLAVNLPKEAKVNDAYFYLEAKGKEDPKSMNCKISHGNGKTDSRVSCLVPQIKDLVDVYVRAHYDGDQRVLQKLTKAHVHATLHEGKNVLTDTAVSAVKKLPLLKRMPLPAE